MGGQIIIRADASTRIGSGHVMRCLTLAEELRDDDVEVSFITRAHAGNLNDLIRGKGFRCHELPKASTGESNEQYVRDPRSEYESWLGVSQQQDARETIEAIGATRAEWLIVDHYGLDEEWERLLRPHAAKIMVIDDLADRRHDCDLLLDQNFFINGKKRYNELVSPSCTKLLGPKYALLRKEFREARKNLRERNGEVKRVLVFLGGSDPDNITGLAIEALSDPELLHLQVDVVIGSQNLHKDKIEKLVQKRPGTTLHIQVANMAELMCVSDLAIGAGGSATWERLSLGVPTIVIPIAKNQIPSTQDLRRLGIVMSLSGDEKVSADLLKNKVMLLMTNAHELLEVSKNSINLVDYDGLKDLTELLIGQLNGIKISHRMATLADCKLYWDWANDAEVRHNAFNSNSISWKDHKEWFVARIKDTRCVLLLFESQYGPVGQVRLNGDATSMTISYSVARQYRAKGIGKKIISDVIQARPPFCRSFLAEVKRENVASANIFERLGFQKAELLEKNAYSFTLNLGNTYQVA